MGDDALVSVDVCWAAEASKRVALVGLVLEEWLFVDRCVFFLAR